MRLPSLQGVEPHRTVGLRQHRPRRASSDDHHRVAFRASLGSSFSRRCYRHRRRGQIVEINMITDPVRPRALDLTILDE
jgi:hypothetical protein